MNPFFLAIVAQVDYYFSPQNLPYDFFLLSLMHPVHGWVPISEVTKFRRMVRMGATHVLTVANALRYSTFVEIDTSENFLRPRPYFTPLLPQYFPFMQSSSSISMRPCNWIGQVIPYIHSTFVQLQVPSTSFRPMPQTNQNGKYLLSIPATGFSENWVEIVEHQAQKDGASLQIYMNNMGSPLKAEASSPLANNPTSREADEIKMDGDLEGDAKILDLGEEVAYSTKVCADERQNEHFGTLETAKASEVGSEVSLPHSPKKSCVERASELKKQFEPQTDSEHELHGKEISPISWRKDASEISTETVSDNESQGMSKKRCEKGRGKKNSRNNVLRSRDKSGIGWKENEVGRKDNVNLGEIEFPPLPQISEVNEAANFVLGGRCERTSYKDVLKMKKLIV